MQFPTSPDIEFTLGSLQLGAIRDDREFHESHNLAEGRVQGNGVYNYTLKPFYLSVSISG